MVDPWLPLLRNLPLTRTEREVVKRFEKQPEGRAFLPIADILRAHRLIDESLELLTQGVNLHPEFTVARVVLARELLEKGLVTDGWKVLEDSPTSLSENLLAQKLRFKFATLLDNEEAAKTVFHHLKLRHMLDGETKRLGDAIELLGFEAARTNLIKDMRGRGIQVVFPPADSNVAASHQDEPASGFPPLEIDIDGEGELAGYHVVPLNEIFQPDDKASAQGELGIELDSTTLADIYAKQGHYSKALAVYRRLLRMTPKNEYLQKKVAEIAKLDREQKDVDLSVDPTLVDRMEELEIIDRQISFYNEMLDRLDG